MKKYLFIILLILLVIPYTHGQELTVATFNAEFLNTSRVHIKFGLNFNLKKESVEIQEFWNNEKNRAKKLEEASAKVAEVLKQINADILTLTEVGDKEDLEVLVAELKKQGVSYEYWEVCDCKDSFTQQHVAVLSKYPIRDVWYEIPGRAIYLEELDGDTEGETGISKGLKATVVVNEKELDVFVFHLKSERGGFDSDAKRLAQASIARRAIVKQLNQRREVIVTGDLNSEKRSPSIYRIRGFDDIYEDLIQTGNSEYFENTDVRWTYNYKGEPEQIDHILVSPGISSKSKIKTSIIAIEDEIVSDHNPVIVRLYFQ